MISQNVIVNGKKIYLKDSNYKAKGGQGNIYLKDNTIFKIYHDIDTLIPEQKIYELQELKQDNNVIVPQQSIYNDQNKRIGFTLKYINNSESLCKIFTNTFKTRNNISVKQVSEIVDNMRDTLIRIHTRNIIVGDYNEMNFLTNEKFANVFYIDTDSYQTKSFKCNAIMHQYRDRVFPLGTFTEESDWFSWALVTFRLYCGIHPYRGKHALDFEKRMNKNISVFDSSVTIPKNIDLNVIPKVHLDYYKDVFVNKNRSIPPKSDGKFNLIVKRKLFVDDKADLTAKLIFKYDYDIISVKYEDGHIWTNTKNGLYKDHSLYKNKYLEKISYKLTATCLAQITYENFGKNVIQVYKSISTISYNSSKLYNGVVMQDVYGKYTATIPYCFNKCSNIKIPELSNTRVIDANRQHKWLFVVYKKGSNTNCLIAHLTNNYTNYECTIIKNVDFVELNVLVKSNGVVILNTEDCTLQLFNDINGNVKEMKNTPIYNDYKLIELHKTCFYRSTELYELNNKL